MSELQEVQQRFLRYLLHGEHGIRDDVAHGEGYLRRLSIYYNAYRSRLRESLDNDHPVLGLYLGDELFDRLVSGYIDAHPSSYTSLRHFCEHVPEFLASASPFSETPVLAELAGFERTLLAAFDAADGPRRDPGFLEGLATDEWPTLTLEFHGSVRRLLTDWNTVEIWQAIKAGRAPPPARAGAPAAWLVWRNRERLTEFRSLAVDEYELLGMATNGESFATLCEALLEWHDDISAAERALAILQGWLAHGLVAGGPGERS